MERKLNDDQQFRVVKVFYERADLQECLVELGWRGSVRTSGEFFLYGSVEPARG